MNQEFMRIAIQKIGELVLLNRDFAREQTKEYRLYRKRKDIDYEELLTFVHTLYNPCFVLSTGRCGTKLLTKLLGVSKSISAYHGHPGAFRYYRKFAYELNQANPEALTQVLEATRTETLVKEYLSGRIYVETDPRITFFALQVGKLYEGSRFIHLVRHPGDFVRSRMRGETYMKNSLDDLGTIVHKNKAKWNNLRRLEKISWLWNETNSFIEHFKGTLDNESRVMTIRSEDLFSNVKVARSIFDFLGVRYIGDRKVKRLISAPVNKRRVGSFPKYQDWSDEQKEAMKRHVKIHGVYGYQI